MQKTFSYKSSSIAYTVLGTGPEALFCFHGYGLNAQTFAFLEPVLGQFYTFICLDFPFHGETDWRERLLFLPEDLLAIMHAVNPYPAKKINLLGYSMGGRICLYLLQMIPDKINKIVLVAPDGLHKNPWQRFATQTRIGNKLFFFTMKYPGILFLLMSIAEKIGSFNKNLKKFVHYYLNDPEERLRLYDRWTTMRKFQPNTLLLKNIVKQQRKHVSILFGKHDSVILTKKGLAFSKGVEDFVMVKEIEAGHQLMKEKHRQEITALFTN